MRDDGVLEARPKVPVKADQAWFWSEWWQLMERKADDGVAAGRVARSKRCCQMYSMGVTVEATPCRASNHAIEVRNSVGVVAMEKSGPRRQALGGPATVAYACHRHDVALDVRIICLLRRTTRVERQRPQAIKLRPQVGR